MTGTRAIILKTGALVLVTSLVSTTLVVLGVRVVQDRWFPTFRRVPLTVSLPGSRPSSLTFAGHESPTTSTSAVTARLGATGLVTVTDAGGDPVGLDVVPASSDLRNIPQVVDYASTARALVELSAFPSSSPILSALVQMAAASSPALPPLVRVLSTEAAQRPGYLVHFDASEKSALAAADADVQRSLDALFAAPPQRSPTVSTSTTQVPGAGRVSPGTSVTTGPAPGGVIESSSVPLVAESMLTNAVPLLDQNGQSACQSHAIVDALCLAAPLPALGQYLDLTNWTESWQLVYRTADLETPGGVVSPISLLPPAVNAPPTIGGTVALSVQTLTTKALDGNICQQSAGVPNPSTNNWIPPAVCSEGTLGALGSALLSELTLTAQSNTVQDYVDPALYRSPLTVVGSAGFDSNVPPASSAVMAQQEYIASAVCEDLTVLTEIVVPVIGLLVDQVFKEKGEGEPGPEHPDAEEGGQLSKDQQDAASLEAADNAAVPADGAQEAAQLDAAGQSDVVQAGQADLAEATVDEQIVQKVTGDSQTFEQSKSALTAARTSATDTLNQDLRLANSQFGQDSANAGAALRGAEDSAGSDPAALQKARDQYTNALQAAKDKLETAQQKAFARFDQSGAQATVDFERANGLTTASPQEEELAAKQKSTDEQIATAAQSVQIVDNQVISPGGNGPAAAKRLSEDSHKEESYWSKHLQAGGREALSALLTGVLGSQGALGPATAALYGTQAGGSAQAVAPIAFQVAGVMFGHLQDLLPIIFPQLLDPAAIAGIVAGVAFSFAVALFPDVVGQVITGIDKVITVGGDVQTWLDLIETLVKVPSIHQYPALSTVTGPVGSRNVSPLYQLAAPSHAGSLGLALLGSTLTATAVVGSSPSGASFTIAPAREVAGTDVGVFNVSQLGELHLGGSGTKTTGAAGSLGSVPFSVMRALLPVGEGAVSFASAPTPGQSVTVADEGSGFHLGTVPAQVDQVISLPDALGHPVVVAMTLRPDRSLATSTAYEGGFVYADTGGQAGQLMGLVELQTGGELTALSGIGVEYLFCQAEPQLCVTYR